jgi:hypothetical protein
MTRPIKLEKKDKIRQADKEKTYYVIYFTINNRSPV